MVKGYSRARQQEQSTLAGRPPYRNAGLDLLYKSLVLHSLTEQGCRAVAAVHMPHVPHMCFRFKQM